MCRGFESIFKARSMVIYGAGEYARRLIAVIKSKRKADRIVGLTTSDTETDGTIYGYPLRPIRAYRKPTDVLVVAVSPTKAPQLELSVLPQFQQIYYMTSEDYKMTTQELERMPLIVNKIFVDCYDGMGYRCNCKYICQYILEHKLSMEIVWKVRKEYANELPEEIRQVYVDTPELYLEVYTSKFILTNVVFPKVRKDQYSIWTWHGTGPFKKGGAGAFERTPENEKLFRQTYQGIDLYVSNSHDNSEMYRNDFYFEGEIAEWGYPRNDILFHYEEQNLILRKQYGIPKEKKIVLYVPTFREKINESFAHYQLQIDRILDSLNKTFGGDFIFMYRFHHLLRNDERCLGYYDRGYNATDYEDTQELLVMSDVLITDYSSIMWDFSLMGKPVFLYQNDREEYENERGFYWPPEEWSYPIAHDNDGLCELIEQFDTGVYRKNLDAFFRRDPSYDDGHATKRVVDRIITIMNE